MKLSIIIPAYNEEKRIGNTLESYLKYFDMLSNNLDYEILVVINGTTDNTVSVVKKYMRNHTSLRYLDIKKGGKGNAVITGFKDALKRSPDLIGFVDADEATPPQAFHALIMSLNQKDDGAIASRHISGSIVHPKQSFLRRLASRVFNTLIHALFLMPYHDTQCGAKVFRAEAIKKVLPNLHMARWAFDVELLYHLRRNNKKIIEVPTIWRDKSESKINIIRSSLSMARGVINLRLANSPFSRFFQKKGL